MGKDKKLDGRHLENSGIFFKSRHAFLQLGCSHGVRCIPKSELHDHPSLKETSHNVTGWRFPKCCRPQNTACVRTLDVSPSHRIPIDAKQGFGGTGYTQHRATNILHTPSHHTQSHPINSCCSMLQHKFTFWDGEHQRITP